MKCPKCKGRGLTKDSRIDEKYNVVYRRYQCKACEHIFYTSEMEDSREAFIEAQAQYREEYKRKCEQ